MKKFKKIGSTIHTAVIMVKPLENNVENSIEKEIQRKRNIDFLYCFRPIYYFSRIFGSMPFSIIHDSNGDVKKSRITIFDGFWFVISICIYSAAVFLIFDSKIMDQASPTFVTILGNTFIMMNITHGVLSVPIEMCNRFKFIEIVKNFVIFDKDVRF